MERNQNRFGRRGFTSTSPSSTSIANFGNSAMTRGTFMRGLGLAGAGVAAAGLGLGGVTHAADHIEVLSNGDIRVYPLPAQTDKAPVDVKNVQWAVDNVVLGGTVHLMAHDINGNLNAFNFGDAGSVRGKQVVITRNTSIIGETLASQMNFSSPHGTIQSDRAVIYGGGIANFPNGGYFTAPLFVYADSKVQISSLRFDSFGNAAISVKKCNGVEITDNVMTNVVPLYCLINEVYFAYGVLVSALNADFTYQSMLGEILIANNAIDLYGPSRDFNEYVLFGAGIGVADIKTGPSINITNNLIENPGPWGIWVPGTQNSEILIDRNEVHQRRNLGHAYLWGGGIAVYPHDVGLGAVPAGKPTITNNGLYNIVSVNSGEWPQPTGIFLHFVVGTPENNNLIGNNVIQGSGTYAIMVDDNCVFNTFNISSGNLDGFTPTIAHIYLTSNATLNTVNMNGIPYVKYPAPFEPGKLYIRDDDSNTIIS